MARGTRHQAPDDLTPEGAVRRYVEFLADPDSFDDAEHVAELERRLAESTDVLQRLELRRELREAKAGPGDRLTRDFVEHARRYAEDAGLTTEDFQAVGVPARVLSQAGLGSRRRPSRPAPKGTRAASRQRSSAGPPG